MRRSFLFVLLIAGSLVHAHADENVVQEFSGSGSTTTGLFKVQDKWEVRWNARQVISVAVMSSDGTIVAGAAGVLRGSLFVPLGGRYYFKVSDGTTDSPAPATNAAPGTPADAAVSWHLQVVEVGTSVASTQGLTVYTPYFMMPDAAVTPAPAPPPEPPAPVLTDDQIHSVVTIKGDRAQGYGFLVKSADGTFVATHLHLLAANPNVKIYTDTGAPITTLSLKGATDHDLALFTIKDDGYHYLPMTTDATADVAVGDAIIIPDTGQAPLAGKPSKVGALTPDRLDFDNIMMQMPMNPLQFSPFGYSRPDMGHSWNANNEGVPVIQVKNGMGLAIMTAEKRLDLTDTVAKAWANNPTPGFARITPYYGLRLTSPSKWETLDPQRFLAETLFLRQFHTNTRCLDSYLNGRKFHVEDGPPDNRFFLTNAKLQKASESYKQLASDSDQSEHLEAARELSSDLVSFADADIGTLQDPSLYAFDQLRAQEELAYRKVLRKEIDDLSNNIVHLDAVARTR